MNRAGLFDFLVSKIPETEQQKLVWEALASRHLYLTKQNPFQDHSAELDMIKKLAEQYAVEYPLPQVLHGMKFLEELIREKPNNEEIKRRAKEFTTRNAGDGSEPAPGIRANNTPTSDIEPGIGYIGTPTP